jgi:hypothetical protein
MKDYVDLGVQNADGISSVCEGCHCRYFACELCKCPYHFLPLVCKVFHMLRFLLKQDSILLLQNLYLFAELGEVLVVAANFLFVG